MRPTAWVSFLAVFLLTAAVASGISTAQAMAARLPPKPTKAEPPSPPPSWVVKGDWSETDDEAVKSALESARAEVTKYLRSQKPPMEWLPDPTWIQQQLLRDFRPDDAELEKLGFKSAREVTIGGRAVQVETRHFDEKLGDLRQAALRIEVSQFARNEIEEQERHYQVKQRQDRASLRQGVLVRILGGMVALLAAVACYLRLEDATKGYYTTLLRLAAVGFVALVGAGIWLLT